MKSKETSLLVKLGLIATNLSFTKGDQSNDNTTTTTINQVGVECIDIFLTMHAAICADQ